MYMPLRGYTGQPVEGSLQTIIQSTQYRDRIRMITLPKKEAATPQHTFEGARWEIPSPTTAVLMSAAAYFFAQSLTEALDVPVGIVSTSWGGSKIEAWMDPASLTAMGYDVEKINADPKIQQRAKCGLLYNGLIAPVAGYTARGFAWYQGEANRKESAPLCTAHAGDGPLLARRMGRYEKPDVLPLRADCPLLLQRRRCDRRRTG